MAIKVGGKAVVHEDPDEPVVITVSSKSKTQTIQTTKGEIQSPTPPKGELSGVLAKIRKELGDKAIVQGSQIPKVSRLPTGVFEFDLATGGGFPRARYSIIYGPESSCKTNLMYKGIASAQRLPPPCNKAVLVDLEGTFDPEYAYHFGVDVESLVVAKPSYGEQAVDMIDALLHADDVAFLGVDSLAALIAAKELEGSTEKMDVGTASLLTKRLAGKVAVGLSEEQKRGHEPCVVFINQTRFKIGVMFGNPETMPGGKTILFYASLIIRVSGKNVMVKEISSNISSFKEISAGIKKAKIGIAQESFDFSMCMLPHDGLCIGDTDSFSKVKGYLQASGDLKKSEKGGWDLLGKNYPTLAMIQDFYRSEDEFAISLQQLVVKNYKMMYVDLKPLEESDG